MGAESIHEIQLADVADEFVAALQLKPIKVKQLRKQLDAPMPAASSKKTSATSSNKMNAKI